MRDNVAIPKQRGSFMEELTDQFCARSFLRDFLFLRPEAVSGRGELTDLLVILEDKCLCIQIKASGKSTQRSGQNLTKWATKKFVKAGNQTSGAIRKVMTSAISAIHLWQGNVVFQVGALLPFCGIALVEYFGPPFIIAADIRHQTSEGIPIHYFSLNDFFNLADLLGTLPDTIEYLQQRASISEEARSIIGKERDLYATYLLDGRLRPGLGSKDVENRWSYMIGVKGESFERKHKHDIFVDFYNGLIDELHKRDPDSLSYIPPELNSVIESMSNKTRYLEIAARLNKLPYVCRREIGKRLFQAAKDVKKDSKERMFTYPNLGQPWVLAFLVTPNIDRMSRIRELHLLVASVQIQYGCQSVVGIACPSLDSKQGYDYIFIDKVTYDKDEISKLGPTITKRNLITFNTFPDQADDSLLPTDEDFE